MDYPLWLFGFGVALGVVGTLIGAGGGFVLVPVLLVLYPQAPPETITSISLAVVFFNALSGSLSYARMKRIDYRSGLLFAAATIPGAVLGALSTNYIPRRAFNLVFGVLLTGAAIYLMMHRLDTAPSAGHTQPGHVKRRLVEAGGTVHTYSFNLKIGMWLSLFVGYVSSVLGIGGGIVHVPALVRLLNFPVHIATATSHFMLAIMALTATIVHVLEGSFAPADVSRTLWLGLGVVLGAPIGAALSVRMQGRWIIRGLALALAFVGLRILWMAR